MNDAITAYPLYWPARRARTHSGFRVRGQFGRREHGRGQFGREYGSCKRELTLADARQRLQAELDRIGASRIILSTNLELRLDGLPRSSQPEPSDPGVACWFTLDGKDMVLPCDGYERVADNVAAIAAHIAATRAIERYGVGTLEEAEAKFRERARECHPDMGGHHAQMAELNQAIADARKEFGGR